MERPRQLTPSFVKGVKQPGRYGDGRGSHGLSLLVKQSSTDRVSKSWAQRLRIRGQAFNVGLGSYPLVSLSTARDKALANAKMVAEGGDPRIPPVVVPTFAEAVDKVIALHSPGWKHEKTERRWRATLETYAFPVMQNKLVSEITTADVMAALGPIWLAKQETGQKVRERVSAIMKWSIAQGHRRDNPAGPDIIKALPKQSQPVEHHAYVPYMRVGDALNKIHATDAWRFTKLCAEFVALTAVRSGEARLATWSEIDEMEMTWSIPAHRMKMRFEHRVPLSDAAMNVLVEARDLKFPEFPDCDLEGLLFPSPTGRALTDNTLSKLFRENNIGCVPHGLRSSFRTYCAEVRTDIPREIAEHALAHIEGTESELAYRRTDYFEIRRGLMEDWGEYVQTCMRMPEGWG